MSSVKNIPPQFEFEFIEITARFNISIQYKYTLINKTTNCILENCILESNMSIDDMEELLFHFKIKEPENLVGKTFKAKDYISHALINFIKKLKLMRELNKCT